MKDDQIKFDLDIDKLAATTIVFCRIGDGHSLKYVYEMVGKDQHFLGFKVRIIVIDAEDEAMKLPWNVDVEIYSGPDWDIVLKKRIEESPGLPAPTFVNYDKAIADRYNEIGKEISLKYKPDYIPSSEVKKVMVLGSRFSTMVGPAAKRLADALKKQGFEVDFFEEKDCYDRITQMSINKRLTEFNPDAFVNMINPFPIHVPGIKRFCWVQDPYFGEIDPACKGYIVGSICQAFDAQYKIDEYRVVRFPMSVDPDEILAHAIKKKDIGISFVSNMSLHDPFYAEHKVMIDKMIEWAITYITEMGIEKYSIKRYKNTVLQCLMEIGGMTSSIPMYLVHYYRQVIERYAHRIVELRRIIKEHGPVEIYGKGWEATEFADYSKGPTTDPLGIAARSKQVVHINHHTQEHPRVYEAVLLGAKVIGSDITEADVYKKYTYDARAKQLVELWK